MRGLQIAAAIGLTAALSGCRAFGLAGGGTPAKHTRPIFIVLVQKAGTCQPAPSNSAQHAFRNDTIAWELQNTCDSRKTVSIAPHNGSGNPFTTNAPWTTAADQNGDNSSSPLPTDIRSDAQTGSYKFDVTVDGKAYDPRLEIDPYQP